MSAMQLYDKHASNSVQELDVVIVKHPNDIPHDYNGPIGAHYKLFRKPRDIFTVEYHIYPNIDYVKLKQSLDKVIIHIATDGQLLYTNQVFDEFQWTTHQQQKLTPTIPISLSTHKYETNSRSFNTTI